MLPENRIPTHPGVILLEEFLKPQGTEEYGDGRDLRYAGGPS